MSRRLMRGYRNLSGVTLWKVTSLVMQLHLKQPVSRLGPWDALLKKVLLRCTDASLDSFPKVGGTYGRDRSDGADWNDDHITLDCLVSFFESGTKLALASMR